MLVNLKKSKDNINLIFSKENEKSNDNNVEISENSTLDSEDTIITFDEKEKENKLIPFEEIFHQYYVDSSQNRNGNFDAYIKSGLKLISLFQRKIILIKLKKFHLLLN